MLALAAYNAAGRSEFIIFRNCFKISSSGLAVAVEA
jgi:hypothetical protein